MLKKLTSIFSLVFILSGCGKSADNPRMDPGGDTPSEVAFSSETLRERTQILTDLLDERLASTGAGPTIRFKFFKSIAPGVVEAMLEVEMERAKVLEYRKAVNARSDISEPLRNEITRLYKRYKTEDLDELVKRVDAIPLDMLFTQSALESGSGKSAIARDCNNIFGVYAANAAQSCPGHTVLAYYPSFAGSIKRYVLLLNSGSAYGVLRTNRMKTRAAVGEGAALDSSVLLPGILRYSERGQAYVNAISSGIRADRLDQLYRQFNQRIR